MARTLPKGWSYRELGDLVRISSGGTPARSNAGYWGGSMPWITAKDLKVFDLQDSQERLTDAGAERASVAPENTVLMLVRGMGLFKGIPIGVTSRPMAFNQDIKALHPKEDITARFLGYALQGQRHYLMGNVDQAGHGTGRLPTSVVEELPLPVPKKLDEQRRIVRVLDAADRLIRAERVRTEYLRQLRRAVVSRSIKQVNAGRAKKLVLSELADVRMSGVDKKTVQGESAVLLCNYMDVFYNEVINEEVDFMRASATQTEIDRFTLRQGDVLLTKDSEVADEIAECAFVESDLPSVLCGYHLALLRPDKKRVLGQYLAIALRDPHVRHQFARCANGVTRFGLTLDAFDQIEIALPGLKDQQKVTEIYTTLSKRITASKKLAEQLVEQKRGLMQQLLTGQHRLTRDLPGMEPGDV